MSLIDLEEFTDPFFYVPLLIIVGGLVWYFFFSEKQHASARVVDSTTTNSLASLATNANKNTKKNKTTGTGQPMKIFFGSQTGTAEDFSHKLASEGRLYGFDPEVLDLEEYDVDEMKNEPFVIFCVATYGEGEPTDNARQFHEWIISKDRESDALKGVKYTVFGLGNKTYEHYNLMGKLFDRRMSELGADRIFRHGEGDDDGSLEDDFAAWKKELWPALVKHFNIQIDIKLLENQNTRRFKIELHDKAKHISNRHLHCKKAAAISFDIKNPYLGKIVVNRELHSAESDRSCRHIEIEVSNAVRYETGDHLGVYPENDIKLVNAVAKRLDIDLDQIFSMVPVESKGPVRPFLGPCTVRQALLQWVDLSGSPRKSFLSVLAHYAQDPKEKDLLTKLSDDSDHTTYTSFIKEHYRSIYEVLEEFKSVKIPFDHFVEAAPRLAPRYYSISSSPKLNPNRVHLTCVVVNFTTPTGRVHDGVCSNWLARQVPGTAPIDVPVFVEKANFRLPRDPTCGVIMVGPGTGLAPFRGFIQDRTWLMQNKGIKTDNILFFGCRSPSIDYIYKDELDEAVQKGVLSDLTVAFSRQGDKKVYVQHKIAEKGAELWSMLDKKNAYFYVCGDARNMAKDVRRALVNVIIQHGHKSEAEAEQFVQKMQDGGRYLTDVWF